MAEFTKERTGSKRPKPILALPRGRSAGYGARVLEVFLVLGKKPAGCVVCNLPIPAGSSRLQIVVSCPTSWVREQQPASVCESIETQQYYLHPGCLTDRIRPEIVRFGLDCYDCGALPPKNDQGFDVRHPFRCFTVSKFAPGHLCENCIRKPRWRRCSICEVAYPVWMISRITAGLKPPPPSFDPFDADYTPIVEAGAEACVHCAQRWKLVTEEEDAEVRSEYARLRQEILEHGVFDAGDDT